MKKFLYHALFFIAIVAVAGAALLGLSKASTHNVVEIKKERQTRVVGVVSEDIPVEDIPVEDITLPDELDHVVHEEEIIVAKIVGIPSNIQVYLQDDVLELKDGMSLEQVEKIWGKPDEVKKKYSGNSSDITWRWGEFREKDSKLKGYWHYKIANFANEELAYWTKDGRSINIKTHTRDDLQNGHLLNLSKGMSKLDVYKIWGIPISVDIDVFSDDKIETDWHYYKKDGRGLSHYADFKNNKLHRWGDY